MWIESHPDLENHPKTLLLQKLWGFDIDQTVGKLHRFWWWCSKYAEDSDLRSHGMAAICKHLRLNEADRGLIKAGFIDTNPYLRVHNWWKYAGRYFKLKYRNQPDKLIQIESACTARPKTRLRHAKDTLKTRLSAPSSLPTSPSLPAFPAKSEETTVLSKGGEKKTATVHPKGCTCESCWKRMVR